jgi:hypothetical protein
MTLPNSDTHSGYLTPMPFTKLIPSGMPKLSGSFIASSSIMLLLTHPTSHPSTMFSECNGMVTVTVCQWHSLSLCLHHIVFSEYHAVSLSAIVDPANVIRGVHLIPTYTLRKTSPLLPMDMVHCRYSHLIDTSYLWLA